jgi:hypothetical protein
MPCSEFARAFALVHLWHWFIASQFTARDLSYPLALGLSLTISLFFWDIGSARNKELSPWQISAISIGGSGLALGFGWIYQQFM